MDLNYDETEEGITQLLNDLAMPWEGPWSFSGFGTPFQEKISKFPDTSEAIKAVDRALLAWSSKVHPIKTLTLISKIITHFQELPQTDTERWESAIYNVVGALSDVHPQAVKQFQQQSDKKSALHKYIPDEL